MFGIYLRYIYVHIIRFNPTLTCSSPIPRECTRVVGDRQSKTHQHQPGCADHWNVSRGVLKPLRVGYFDRVLPFVGHACPPAGSRVAGERQSKTHQH